MVAIKRHIPGGFWQRLFLHRSGREKAKIKASAGWLSSGNSTGIPVPSLSGGCRQLLEFLWHCHFSLHHFHKLYSTMCPCGITCLICKDYQSLVGAHSNPTWLHLNLRQSSKCIQVLSYSQALDSCSLWGGRWGYSSNPHWGDTSK